MAKVRCIQAGRIMGKGYSLGEYYDDNDHDVASSPQRFEPVQEKPKKAPAKKEPATKRAAVKK